MKYLNLFLILLSFVRCKSYCVIQNEANDIFFTERYYLYEIYPLESFLDYRSTKKEVEKIVDLKICNIKDICATKFNDTVFNFAHSNLFCELYFYFEHKSNHIFKINRLEMWFFISENITFYSNQTVNSSGNFLITTR